MVERVDWVPNEDWTRIIANAPVVSVDLVVRTPAGVVLGLRRNEPAKGEWFVPGGTVHKGEHLSEAVHRVGESELGTNVNIVEQLGTYEHLYDTAEASPVGGKHYVAHGYVVETDCTTFEADDQHSSIRPFEHLPDDLHPYVEDYLVDANVSDI